MNLAQDLFGMMRDAHAEGRKIEADVQRELAAANAEVDHRMSPEDLDTYARALDRAQRKLGVREIALQPGEF